MAMNGLVGTGMEVVDGMHVGQSYGVGRISRDARSSSECELIH